MEPDSPSVGRPFLPRYPDSYPHGNSQNDQEHAHPYQYPKQSPPYSAKPLPHPLPAGARPPAPSPIDVPGYQRLLIKRTRKVNGTVVRRRTGESIRGV
ncbi:hypothetical protein N656DRAFT_776209 [Canariomyces notabilis]|uniref:Uncharacterized protein n=1 Tax=Canariomyces notabilis TaxID=2074819 RepID=A0AAN6TIR0_9PEZI|nr:hypothetical protein N656DRAFT_776209 [Canariomyces arenarius]